MENPTSLWKRRFLPVLTSALIGGTIAVTASRGRAVEADPMAASSPPLQAGDGAGSTAPIAAVRGPEGDQQDPAADADDAVEAAFAAAGVQLDRSTGSVAFSARTEVRSELLEYVLVNPHGAIHESLFVTAADARVLETAFLTAGAKEGSNVDYVPKDPAPTEEELRSGVPTHDVVLPAGDPVYLYVAWREAAGVPDAATGMHPAEAWHFHRIEDLIVDLARDRTLRRHGWVWLGSRMIEAEDEAEPDRFAADVTGNLVCVSFFGQGDTLLTPALPECASQTSWIANYWMLPAKGAEVLLIGSVGELREVPAAFREAVPFLPVDVADPDPQGAR